LATETRLSGLDRDTVQTLSHAAGEPDWLRRRRLEAFELFESLPMPSRTDENWRRTDLRGLDLTGLHLPRGGGVAEAVSPMSLRSDGFGGELVMSQDELVRADLAMDLQEQGVVFCSLVEAIRRVPEVVEPFLSNPAVEAERGKFEALNAAFWGSGIFLYVPPETDVALPLRALVGLASVGSATFPRTLLVVGDGAKVVYGEEYASPPLQGQPTLSAGVVEVHVGERASLSMVTLQEFLGNVYDINTQQALLARDSTLNWLVVGLGEGITKSNIDVAMQGPGASTQMHGILWGYGHQHTDYHTLQDHQAPHCTSDLLYKGALIDDAVSVFSGRIRVAKGAHRTDSYQANRTVILSDHAAAFPSPNLEIEANDVRCTHGASVGRVDADQLFYLMSRGLSRDVATKMIVEGFFEEVLQREPAESVRDNLRDLIRRKMEEQTARA